VNRRSYTTSVQETGLGGFTLLHDSVLTMDFDVFYYVHIITTNKH